MSSTLSFESPDDGVVKILQDLAPVGDEVAEKDVVARFKAVAGENKLPILNHMLKYLSDQGIIDWRPNVSVKIIALPGDMPPGFWDDEETK